MYTIHLHKRMWICGYIYLTGDVLPASYGNDKQSKIYNLFAQGAYFVVLPNSFQVSPLTLTLTLNP